MEHDEIILTLEEIHAVDFDQTALTKIGNVGMLMDTIAQKRDASETKLIIESQSRQQALCFGRHLR